MTNIIVKRNVAALASLPSVADNDQRTRMLGMADAGDAINTWMIDANNDDPLAEEFFDDLFDELNGSADAESRFYVEATDLGGNSVDQRVRAPGHNYRFSLNGKRHRLKIKCEEDERQVKRKVKMNIGIPEKRGNLLAGGYLNKIFTDLNAYITAGKNTEAKQYLLAVIFLNRCQ